MDQVGLLLKFLCDAMANQLGAIIHHYYMWGRSHRHAFPEITPVKSCTVYTTLPTRATILMVMRFLNFQYDVLLGALLWEQLANTRPLPLVNKATYLYEHEACPRAKCVILLRQRDCRRVGIRSTNLARVLLASSPPRSHERYGYGVSSDPVLGWL